MERLSLCMGVFKEYVLEDRRLVMGGDRKKAEGAAEHFAESYIQTSESWEELMRWLDDFVEYSRIRQGCWDDFYDEWYEDNWREEDPLPICERTLTLRNDDDPICLDN